MIAGRCRNATENYRQLHRHTAVNVLLSALLPGKKKHGARCVIIYKAVKAGREPRGPKFMTAHEQNCRD